MAQAVRDRAGELEAALADPHAANEYVLKLWKLAPVEDWPAWSAAIVTESENAAHDDAAAEMLVQLFNRYGDLDEDDQLEFGAHVSRVLTLQQAGLARVQKPLAEALETALRSQTSWSTSEAAQRCRALHDVIRIVGRVDGAPAVERVLGEDVRRPLQASSDDPTARLAAVRTLANGLPPEQLRQLASDLNELAVEPGRAGVRVVPAPDPNDIVFTRAVLARLAKDAGAGDWQAAPFEVNGDDLATALAAESPVGSKAAEAALLLEPTAGQVRQAFAGIDYKVPPDLKDAVAAWASALAKGPRTTFIDRLIAMPSDTTQLIQLLATNYADDRLRADERRLIEKVLSLMAQSGTWQSRELLARKAAALHPTTASGRKELALLIKWLLHPRRTRKDVEVALAALMGLTAGHGEVRALDSMFKAAAKRCDRKATKEEIDAFARAGLTVPKELVRKSWLERVFGR